ncbi:MAG: hypothetical protein R3293_25465 [Candidatus Promineifilaceae bacterium]|nr:hypothetical protein [Candidatus Promineifilaceae bacterium]
MYTSSDYNRFHAQSKMSQLHQQADIHRQLKQVEKPKFSPISINKVKHLIMVLKSKLVRPVYILKPENQVNN